MFEHKKYISKVSLKKLANHYIFKEATILLKNMTTSFKDFGPEYPLVYALNPEVTIYIKHNNGSFEQLECTHLGKTLKINHVYINNVKVR